MEAAVYALLLRAVQALESCAQSLDKQNKIQEEHLFIVKESIAVNESRYQQHIKMQAQACGQA